MTSARIPIATYRLQFNSRFTFRDAHAIVDYLHDLRISDCYASSYLKAIPGSPHGYDVSDPTRLNPDLGTDADYLEWIDALHRRGMRHVMDLVPNHMGIARSANPWWQDVLENGASSPFAHFFDIEWHPVKAELAHKVLIPILGDQYGAVLDRQELQLCYRDGSFAIAYYDNAFPVAPDTYPLILDQQLGGLTNALPTTVLDELKSIMTAAANLPPRTTRDAEQIATRAREKEIVKRRLAALTESSEPVQAYVDRMLALFNGTRGIPGSFDLLDRLLNEQSYRLAHWRVASEEINYRRFFDVNELAALRMEDPSVFEEVHRFALELIRSGAVSGLRIDHVDGLYAPADYLERLQRRAGELAPSAADGTLPFFIVVEKILAAGEQLPDWPTHGTTGYEFAAAVNRLFVDRRSEQALTDIYARFTRERRERLTFDDLVYRSKKQILHETMSGDINSLGHQLNRFSERNRHFRDFTLYSLISTIKEVIACFPVYRTYVTEQGPVTDQDRRYVQGAIRDARRRAPAIPGLIFDFIERLLLKETPIASHEECDDRARVIGKFQQITGPVAAKGIEDTALYVYNRLLSLNEVGADPMQFGIEPSALHEWFIERQRRWPAALSATSTHDTKRGEDVRARINVLSEIPGAWKDAVIKWRALNRRLKSEVQGTLAPGANEEYLLYQTVVGSWPFHADDEETLARFRERIVAFMRKALREAKVHTGWLHPDETYEQAVHRFVHGMLDRRRSAQFFQSFLPFQARVAELAIYSSLAQLVVKITAPGIPDFYQGTELWDLNLVDPDNRRPVEYEKRRQIFESLKSEVRSSKAEGRSLAADLLAHRADGRIKLFTMTRALEARHGWRDLYERGEHIPIQTTGGSRDSLFAFARRYGAATALTCVPRLLASVVPDGTVPPLGPVWTDTRLVMPPLPARCTFRNAFTGTLIQMDDDGTLPVSTIFESFPVALLLPCST